MGEAEHAREVLLTTCEPTALQDGIFAHPTLAEGLNTLFMNLQK